MTDAPAPETRKSPARNWLACYAGAFIYVFIVGLPGLQVLTALSSQLYFHFSFATYLSYLLVVALFALPLAPLLYLVWRPAGRLAPLQRVLAALVLTFPIPAYVQLAAFKLEWFSLTSALGQRYAILVWLALLAPVAISGPVFRAARKVSTVVAKVLSPLPVVMAVFFMGAPAVPSVREAAPEALAETREGAPIYILLFDALDRDRVFKPEHAARYPALFALRNEGVWFEHSSAHGDGTVNVLPCFLHQQRAEVTRNDDGDYLLDGTPSGELDSIFKRLAGENSVRIVGGFHLNYSRLLEDETDWLREYSYYNWNDGAVPILRTHSQLLFNHLYVPHNPPSQGLKALTGVDSFTNDASEHLLHELEAQLFACAAAPNHDLVAFFHLPVPHNPFIYDRDGRRLVLEDPAESSEEAYLKNVEYADALLARFIESARQSGQWEKATLVVMGDHGLSHQDQPALIVRLPGQTAGRVVEDNLDATSLLDWLEQQPEFRARQER